MNTRNSIILSIAIASAVILFLTQPATAQVSIQAGAAISYRQSPALAGHLAISYRYKNIEASASMLTLAVKTPTYFGINAGYILQAGDWSLKPYAGINYKLTGNRISQDRYIHNGTVTTLSTNGEVNKAVGSFGMQIIKGVGYIDAEFLDGFFVAIGLRYTFNKE